MAASFAISPPRPRIALQSNDMQAIYLIRHAQPDWTRTDLVYHQPPGPPLTEEGIRQARLLGEFIRNAGVKRLYTSPLERCEHTARIVGDLTNLSPKILSGLIEWQPGEDIPAVQARLRPVFEQAAAESRNGAVALFTHGGPIAAQLMALGMSEAQVDSHRVFDRNNPVPTAGAWQVTRSATGDAWHLSLAFTPVQGV